MGRVSSRRPRCGWRTGGNTGEHLGGWPCGKIALLVGRLSLTGGGEINSSTTGAGRGGTVSVTATDTIAIAGCGEGFASGLFVNTTDRGPGGSVHVAATHIQLREGGTMAANSTGAGTAGRLQLQVGETFRSEQGRRPPPPSGVAGARLCCGGAAGPAPRK